MAHLGVAHVLIGGQTHGSAMCFQVSMGAGSQQLVQRRGLGNLHGIAAAAVTLANTIHNHKNDRFFHKDSSKIS